jgi:ureidoacrylate peracid hydrolase
MIEVTYLTRESLTLDSRTQSLDYHIIGFHGAKGAWGDRVMDQIAPQGDEIVLAKTSSSVFISNNIDFVIHKLRVKQIMFRGVITDQCVESAIRDNID